MSKEEIFEDTANRPAVIEEAAHVDPLCGFSYEVVDLFSAGTSAIISTVYLWANQELNAVSHGLVRRMKKNWQALWKSDILVPGSTSEKNVLSFQEKENA